MTEFNLTGAQAKELLKQGHQCVSEKYPDVICAYHKKTGNYYVYVAEVGFPYDNSGHPMGGTDEKYKLIDAPRMKWEDS